MENTESPLKNFRRQPKIYISLPSQGKYYKDNIIANNTFTEIPVFSMTASDEILYKTPDAMITGNATSANIKSCIPSVLDPWNIITLDIDTLLIGIRMATYGETMTVHKNCIRCGEDNAYEINLRNYLDFFHTLEYKDRVQIDEFIFNLRPLTYEEWTDIQKTSVAYQRAVSQESANIKDETEKEKFVQSIVQKINELTVMTLFRQIESVEVDGQKESNTNEIIEFMNENDVKYFTKIKEVIEHNTTVWQVPTEDVTCEKCKHESKLKVSLDASDCFATG